jgi:hypothetical protein
VASVSMCILLFFGVPLLHVLPLVCLFLFVLTT